MNQESPKQTPDKAAISKDDLKREASVIEYVNAAATASNRARNITIFLIVATVLVAIEIRNTSYSWNDARIEIREIALKLADPAKNAVLAANEPDLYQRAKLFLERRGFDLNNENDKRMLEKELEIYRTVAIEHINFVHVPFFGVIFDHNDMGMFAGFTFAVLLLWLRYSTARELSNLKLLFNPSIPPEDFKRRYELLAMQQVLTVPRTETGTAFLHYRWIPKVLYFIPLPVYGLQMYFDFRTIMRAGQVWGMGKAWLLVITSIIFLILILIFTILCIRILFRIDEAWDEAAGKAYPVKSTPHL